jgi:hypothetical protein
MVALCFTGTAWKIVVRQEALLIQTEVRGLRRFALSQLRAEATAA